jgi:DNA polymerase
MLREMGIHVWLPATVVQLQDQAEMARAIEEVAAYAYAASATSQNSLQEMALPRPLAAPLEVAANAAAKAQPPAQLPTHPLAPQPAPETTVPRAPVARKASLAPAAAGPTAVTGLPADIVAMAWPQLHDAVRHCQACAMCFGRRAPVFAAPDALTPCDWLVVGDPPDEPQERMGIPFVDEAGVLLDNMLRAVGVQRFLDDGAAQDAAQPTGSAEPGKLAYLTHVLKCRPGVVRAPSATELATCTHYLRREIALTQPKVILAMGRFAMQVLLSETPPESAKLPLGKLRGQVWRFAGVPVVVTYPPSYLVRTPQDKGKAWADLCLAMDVVQGQRQASA